MNTPVLLLEFILKRSRRVFSALFVVYGALVLGVFLCVCTDLREVCQKSDLYFLCAPEVHIRTAQISTIREIPAVRKIEQQSR